MKKMFFLFAIFSLCMVSTYAQEDTNEPKFDGVDGIVPKEHIANRKPVPYAYVREADVLWSKTIWRVIDLREKINLPLYYPTINIDGRKSLTNVLVEALSKGDLRAYSTTTEDEFAKLLPYEDVKVALGATTDTVVVRNPETGLNEQKVIANEPRIEEVKKLMLKEVWFFDKNYTRMDVRIIGICPIRESMSDDGSRVDQKLLFWVYFPQARPFLARNEVFNLKNDAIRYSFDDIFNKRYFGSYIFRESNVYNNRAIMGYAAGMETTLEAERIKNELFVKEHDMWEF